MKFIKNQRVILVALISAKKTIETELEKIEAKINFDEGKVVGKIIQIRKRCLKGQKTRWGKKNGLANESRNIYWKRKSG
jgi:hypothetical protein